MKDWTNVNDALPTAKPDFTNGHYICSDELTALVGNKAYKCRYYIFYDSEGFYYRQHNKLKELKNVEKWTYTL